MNRWSTWNIYKKIKLFHTSGSTNGGSNTPCIFSPWSQRDGGLCRTCTENHLINTFFFFSWSATYFEHNLDELLLVLLPELSQHQHAKVLVGWIRGLHMIGNATLKYISPFFSTSFVISTSSCMNEKLKALVFWFPKLRLLALPPIELKLWASANLHTRMHQTKPGCTKPSLNYL